MSRAHVYFQVFKATGQYTGEWIEVTRDVVKIGNIKQTLDSSEYDFGILKNSNVTINMNNSSGVYSDIAESYSMFRFKRSGTRVKITWEPGDRDLLVGFFTCDDPDAIISEEVTVFNGLLNDDATKESIIDQEITFNCLGYESVLQNLKVPYSSISNGDTFSEILYDCFNQTEVTNLMTLDIGRINPGTDSAVDDVSKLENKTVHEALKKILLPANSVFWVDMNARINIAERNPTDDLIYSFYGPGSLNGGENIASMKYMLGNARIFNFITWKDTSIVSTDATSVGLYGIHKKEIDVDFITNNTTRNNIVDALVDEFSTRKTEIALKTILNPSTAAIEMLSKVNIDLPSITLDPDGLPVAYYGKSEYGSSYYAQEINNIKILSTTSWKVLGRSINVENDLIEFELREV
jgi:hypothetical protein